MYFKFLGRTQKLYLFPEAKKREIGSRQNSENHSSMKLFCSIHKMIVCTQHNNHRFSSKKEILFLSEQKSSTKLWYQTFESLSGQLLFCFKNLGGHLSDSFERISSKLTIRLHCHNLAGFFFVKCRRHCRRFSTRNHWLSIFSKHLLWWERISES